MAIGVIHVSILLNVILLIAVAFLFAARRHQKTVQGNSLQGLGEEVELDVGASSAPVDYGVE